MAWCFRAREAGWRCLVIPAAKVWHRIGVSFGSEESPLRTYFSVRNRLLWCARHVTPRERLRLRIPDLARERKSMDHHDRFVAVAIDAMGLNWLSGIVKLGAIAGLSSVILVMLLSQPRIFYSMARDGLLPPAFARVHPRYRTPYVTTILTGVLVAAFASFANIEEMVDLTNIGTLFAFILVGIGYPGDNPEAGAVLRGRDMSFPGYPRFSTTPPPIDGVVGQPAQRDDAEQFAGPDIVPMQDGEQRRVVAVLDVAQHPAQQTHVGEMREPPGAAVAGVEHVLRLDVEHLGVPERIVAVERDGGQAGPPAKLDEVGAEGRHARPVVAFAVQVLAQASQVGKGSGAAGAIGGCATPSRKSRTGANTTISWSIAISTRASYGYARSSPPSACASGTASACS